MPEALVVLLLVALALAALVLLLLTHLLTHLRARCCGASSPPSSPPLTSTTSPPHSPLPASPALDGTPRVTLNCWFCAHDVPVREDERAAGWFCAHCESYNGFLPPSPPSSPPSSSSSSSSSLTLTAVQRQEARRAYALAKREYGGYNRELPQLRDAVYNVMSFEAVRGAVHKTASENGEHSSAVVSSVLAPGAAPMLCQQCELNQSMIVSLLAHDTSATQAQLEEEYPLCGACRRAVAAHLRQVDQVIRQQQVAQRIILSEAWAREDEYGGGSGLFPSVDYFVYNRLAGPTCASIVQLVHLLVHVLLAVATLVCTAILLDLPLVQARVPPAAGIVLCMPLLLHFARAMAASTLSFKQRTRQPHDILRRAPPSYCTQLCRRFTTLVRVFLAAVVMATPSPDDVPVLRLCVNLDWLTLGVYGLHLLPPIPHFPLPCPGVVWPISLMAAVQTFRVLVLVTLMSSKSSLLETSRGLAQPFQQPRQRRSRRRRTRRRERSPPSSPAPPPAYPFLTQSPHNITLPSPRLQPQSIQQWSLTDDNPFQQADRSSDEESVMSTFSDIPADSLVSFASLSEDAPGLPPLKHKIDDVVDFRESGESSPSSSRSPSPQPPSLNWESGFELAFGRTQPTPPRTPPLPPSRFAPSAQGNPFSLSAPDESSSSSDSSGGSEISEMLGSVQIDPDHAVLAPPAPAGPPLKERLGKWVGPVSVSIPRRFYLAALVLSFLAYSFVPHPAATVVYLAFLGLSLLRFLFHTPRTLSWAVFVGALVGLFWLALVDAVEVDISMLFQSDDLRDLLAEYVDMVRDTLLDHALEVSLLSAIGVWVTLASIDL